VNVDFSVFKNNYIKTLSETFNVQFRAEIFNLLNRANFAPPMNPTNTDIFDSTGAPTGVAGLFPITVRVRLDSLRITSKTELSPYHAPGVL
jgi:hypothetical protein